MKHKLKTEQRGNGWWITGWPAAGFDDCGPYRSKAEAQDDQAGLERTLEQWWDFEKGTWK